MEIKTMNNPISTDLARIPFNKRVLVILVIAIFVSLILTIPYILSLKADSLKTTHLPMPLEILLPLELFVVTFVLGIFAAIGLSVAGRFGLGLPLLESWLTGKPGWNLLRKFILPAIITGLIIGVAILLFTQYVFTPKLEAVSKQLGLNIPSLFNLTPPAWQGFLASFYGGIVEEILMRLFVLSLLVWLGQFISRTGGVRPSLGVFWVANILAALLFGLGHLPTIAAVGVPLDAFVITSVIVLNGLGGIVFGWFYWTFGLESAMLCHFCGDIMIHVISPLLTGH
jgi:hypothetical protein